MRFPGSNWWSFDFHNHTPASSDYNKDERTQLTPRDWLLAYMSSGTDCVAITDHNSGGWIDRLQEELAVMRAEKPPVEGYREIHLFPGVELTTAEGIHVIAVYGPEDSSAKVSGLLALAQYNQEKNNAHGMCEVGAAIICDQISKSGGVSILAHAEEINGIFHGTIEPTTGRFIPTRQDRSIEKVLEKSDGIEIHNLNDPAIQNFSAKLNGRAIVDGSDAHNSNAAGSRRVWLKMAQPSIEGLKLALLDPVSSLLRAADKPLAPSHRITSLRMEQLQLRRQPLDIAFSPWFNAVIGGRGSGKSTVLEALRLAMARESDILELGTDQDSDVVRAFNRFRQTGGARGNSSMVRPETVLTGTVEKYDASSDTNECYAFTWRPSSFNVKRKNEAGDWEDTGLSAEQAAKFFPVKVFSQKQIFELAERPSALLTYIDRAPEVCYQQWEEENESLRRALRELREDERTLIQATAKKAELETELREVSRKTSAYQLSTVAQNLQLFKDNQKAQQSVNNFVGALLLPVTKLEEALGESNPYPLIQLATVTLQLPDSSSVQQMAIETVTDLTAKFDSVQLEIEQIKLRIAAFESHSAVVTYMAETGSAITAYREEVDRLKAEGVGTTAHEAEVALERKQELEIALAKISAEEEQLAEIQKQVRRSYAALKFHRRRLTRLRQNFVQRVLALNPNLKITISGQSDVDQSNNEFRSILRLQDNTFESEILSTDEATGQRSGLLGLLIADGMLDPTHKRVTSLKLGILERSREILSQPINGRLFNAMSRLSVDDDEALLEWFPQDLVRVEFRRNEHDRFQSLERASAGQKTSSVLSFLLSHGDEPLLLDQPEDDLDNALVSELVVAQIRNNKARRQIIVVTHNPNIVVNGDAELVLPMEFLSGQIQQNNAGGLQQGIVRQRICDIMEGGRAAFHQRYKRILKDLDAISLLETK